MTRSCRFILVRLILGDSWSTIDDIDVEIMLHLDSQIHVFPLSALPGNCSKQATSNSQS
jgi:hypothetical protein